MSRQVHWLNARLRDLKISKAELGRQVGLPASRISEIISRKNGPPRKIKTSEVPRFAAALKMTPEELIELSGGEVYGPIGGPPGEFDVTAEAFRLIDTVASVRPLTHHERAELFRKLGPLLAALRPRAL